MPYFEMTSSVVYLEIEPELAGRVGFRYYAVAYPRNDVVSYFYFCNSKDEGEVRCVAVPNSVIRQSPDSCWDYLIEQLTT